MRCDRCGEDWEPEFFCKECESLEIYEPEFDEEDMDDTGHATIERANCCGNCCTCHLRAPVPNARNQGLAPQGETP